MLCMGSDMLKTSFDAIHNLLSFDGENMPIPLVIVSRAEGPSSKKTAVQGDERVLNKLQALKSRNMK